MLYGDNGVILGGVGESIVKRPWAWVESHTEVFVDLTEGIGNVQGFYGEGAVGTNSVQADMDDLVVDVNVANAYTLAGVTFDFNAKKHMVKSDGSVQVNLNPSTGLGTQVGVMTTNQVRLTNWTAGGGSAVTQFRGLATAPVEGPFSPFGGYEVMFRTAVAPLRPGSLNVLGILRDGTTFNVISDDDGFINATRVKGRVNYKTGVVDLFFVSPTGGAGQTTADLSFLQIPGVSGVYLDQARLETLRYNAVSYNYMPLDASLLGIDPVRLPSDGRVPIFRPGGLAVVGNTKTTTPATVSGGQTISVGRVRLSRVRVLGADNMVIHTGYVHNLNAGTVTFNDVSGYAQPVRIEHRVEDMVQVRDAQINGDITFNPALSHQYLEGESYISSAVPAGDLTARVSLVFDQGSWDGITFKDIVEGPVATGTYNTSLSPIEVTNVGAETERWALRFNSTTGFQVIGEHVGVIYTGSINTDCMPINPVTGEPYFVIRALGWGVGWGVGNVVRINTVGARFPLWTVRTVRQGAASGEDYSFSLLTRGDVDNPL